MKRKERAAETEAALKDAAKRVFAERGYLNTKITDITAEAGRAAGSFYNHFAGKEELLEALLADISAHSDEAASASGHKSDFTDPEAVRWHLAYYVRFYREYAVTMRAVQQAALVSESFAEKVAAFGTAEMSDILGHVKYLTDAGYELPASPEVSIRMMYALSDTFLQMWQQQSLDLSDEELIEALTRFVYRGLTGSDY
ncbi:MULTISPECIES: TetR/AcrR family transcriptional regulator [unclassified Streptomyces]|uniref:TetR/AcrR family transcriptional regulator n=1 Tax=unclassified Streptomyces TaxID=2593676 RepID=UPI002DDC4196|nr:MULTISPECIES: TetR/AcrR family transcriptional regulator [unclassified Streptomyces]WSA94619.1 TetR/AcrR family transcriptional regulator [Streptomyces sp. NBC_01795]WSB79039.1 TetR/AcrR family transcriptional regulator [Streptomyces sp. NBC_01775]WSS41544.1 TetR/AcrR family transcriptional regulator [Streptomyces sp. NBC_01187]